MSRIKGEFCKGAGYHESIIIIIIIIIIDINFIIVFIIILMIIQQRPLFRFSSESGYVLAY